MTDQETNVVSMATVDITEERVDYRASTISCSVHADQMLQFYCPLHRSLICSVCAILHHKPCNVNYVPDLAAGFKDSPEYKSFRKDLDKLTAHADVFKKDAAFETKRAISSNDHALERVRQFRSKIIEALDEKEKALVKTSESLREQEEQRLQSITSNCETIKTTAEKLRGKLAAFEDNESNLFVAMKQSKESLDIIKDLAKKCHDAMEVTTYNFQPQSYYETTLEASVPLGTIMRHAESPVVNPLEVPMADKLPIVDVTQAQLEKMPDVNVRSPKDGTKCSIGSVVLLPPSTLLVADRQNYCVKAINTETNTIVSRLQLQSYPSCLTVLPDEQAAVVLQAQQYIQIFSTEGQLEYTRNISVNGMAHGLGYIDGKLIVSFTQPTKVDVLDLDGVVLRTIVNDPSGQALFSWPLYVTTGSDIALPVIYVSDLNNNSVTKMTMDGTVIYTYTHKYFFDPQSMAITEDGHLLVINYFNNIHVVSKEGVRVRTLLGKDTLKDDAQSICYNPYSNKLYFGFFESDELHVFGLQ